ncbi:MAG TPA: DNA starvation/stationary phase protection protein Dps [Steroidobacteraceae bacterium]|nr:DNA starvation/stationary phase protection protein Dps [Steroidobacteraceae bacterium]
MYDTRNDLPAGVRGKVTELLNARLADAIDLGAQAKQAHWNVRGPHFIALHELFDRVAEHMEDHIDTLAERITALGAVAQGTLARVARATTLPPYPEDIAAGEQHLQALSSAVADLGAKARRGIEEAARLGDADTSDLFTGLSRALDKDLWFLEAHLVSTR